MFNSVSYYHVNLSQRLSNCYEFENITNFKQVFKFISGILQKLHTTAGMLNKIFKVIHLKAKSVRQKIIF